MPCIKEFRFFCGQEKITVMNKKSLPQKFFAFCDRLFDILEINQRCYMVDLPVLTMMTASRPFGAPIW